MQNEIILKYVPTGSVKEKRIASSRRPPVQYFCFYFADVLILLLFVEQIRFTGILICLAAILTVPIALFAMYFTYSGHSRFLTESGLYVKQNGRVLHIPWEAVDHAEAVFVDYAFHKLRFIFSPDLADEDAGMVAGLSEKDNTLPCTGKALRCVRRHVPVTAEPDRYVGRDTEYVPESGQAQAFQAEPGNGDGAGGNVRALQLIPLWEVKGKRFGRSGLLPPLYLFLYNLFLCSQAISVKQPGVTGFILYLVAIYPLPVFIWWLFTLAVHGGYRLFLTESGPCIARWGQALRIPWEAVIRVEVTVRGSLNIKLRFVFSQEMADHISRQLPMFPDHGIALHYSRAALSCIRRHVPVEVNLE